MLTGLEPLLEKVALAMAASGPYRAPAAAQHLRPAPVPRRGMPGKGLLLGLGAGTALAAGAGLMHQRNEDEQKYRQLDVPLQGVY